MIVSYLIAMLIILGLLSGWIAVQHWSRSFNARHPELAMSTEEEGAGCGMFCFCKHGLKCPRKAPQETSSIDKTDSSTH